MFVVCSLLALDVVPQPPGATQALSRLTPTTVMMIWRSACAHLTPAPPPPADRHQRREPVATCEPLGRWAENGGSFRWRRRDAAPLQKENGSENVSDLGLMIFNTLG